MSLAIEPLATTAVPRSAPAADLALLLGRIALVAIYLLSGIGKAEDLGMLEALLRTGGIPVPALVAVGAVTIELGAALAILLGWRARAAAAALIGFTAAATLLVHPFWIATPPFREDQFVHFMKNLGLAGGLLLLLATGPGRFALGRAR